jgi:hypothetical protein
MCITVMGERSHNVQYCSFNSHHLLSISVGGPVLSGCIVYDLLCILFVSLCIYCRNELISVNLRTLQIPHGIESNYFFLYLLVQTFTTLKSVSYKSYEA